MLWLEMDALVPGRFVGWQSGEMSIFSFPHISTSNLQGRYKVPRWLTHMIDVFFSSFFFDLRASNLCNKSCPSAIGRPLEGHAFAFQCL